MTLPHVKTNDMVLFEFCVEQPVGKHEFCCHKGRKSFFQFLQANYLAFFGRLLCSTVFEQ